MISKSHLKLFKHKNASVYSIFLHHFQINLKQLFENILMTRNTFKLLQAEVSHEKILTTCHPIYNKLVDKIPNSPEAQCSGIDRTKIMGNPQIQGQTPIMGNP